MDAEAHLGVTSTSAELGSGIKRLEGAIEIAVAAGGVDVSAARARVEKLQAAEARRGESQCVNATLS